MTSDYATYPIDELRQISGMPIEVAVDREVLASAFTEHVLEHVRAANRQGRRTVIIMPVGPTGQWRLAAQIAKRDGIDLSGLCIISMDEYLAPDAVHALPETDPFSFAGFIRRNFADEAAASCGFQMENWVAPDPSDTDKVDRKIAEWGGVDVAFAGIGLNGHLAFNEPPSPNDHWSEEAFADSPVRVQKIADTTKATNSIFGTGGDLGKVPDYAVTIGMRQILGARQVHVLLDWPWQCNVLRRALLGPVTMYFPASLLQSHSDVRFTVTAEVAAVHEIAPE